MLFLWHFVAMTAGSGIAIAGWFVAFVWACTISENVVAGVVIAGLAIATVRFVSRLKP